MENKQNNTQEDQISLEDINNIGIKALEEHNLRTIEFITKELTSEEASFIPKISESMFVRDFLPALKQYRDGLIDNDDHFINKWLELAGGWYGEVEVYEDGTGDVKYTVPSLLQPNVIDTNTTNNMNMFEMVARAGMEARSSFAQRENFLLPRMSKISKEGINDRSEEYGKRWDNVFDRYDRKEENNKQEVKKEKKVDYGLDYD